MTREEYIKEILSQVKSKYAKPEIEKELNDHIDDRIEYYTDAGYDYDYALYKAMEYMGEPEQVGANMNNIHNETPLLIASIAFQGLFLLSILFMFFTFRIERFIEGFGLNYYVVCQIELFVIAILFAVNYYICSRNNLYKPTLFLGIEALFYNPLGFTRYIFNVLNSEEMYYTEGLDFVGKAYQTIYEFFDVYMLIACIITLCLASYQKARLRQKVHSTIGLRYYACNKLFTFASIIMLGLTIFICVSV